MRVRARLTGVTDVHDLADLSDEQLREVYSAPRRPWTRVLFVATADGATQGADGLSKSISNDADQRVFQTLRDLADVIVVGAGTVREEEYEPNPKPLVVVSRSGEVPESLQKGDLSKVYLATGSEAEHMEAALELLGDRVLVLGKESPDLTQLRAALVDLGLTDILCEGGPSLAGDLFSQGLADELALTVVPRVVGGEHRRPVQGADSDVELRLTSLITAGDTLIQRWTTA
jgi:riboflavin biosynthesis pyrimidine reductase